MSDLADEFTTPIARQLLVVNTASWRSQRPVTDAGKCWLCGTCWLYCPVQCRFDAPGHMETFLDFCKGCGICANECPSGAITMISEPTEA